MEKYTIICPCCDASLTIDATTGAILAHEEKKKILLNLGGVGYIDSSGIGELVSSFTAVNKENGQLKLLNLTQKIQDLLAITKLLTVFDVFENEGEALSGYN